MFITKENLEREIQYVLKQIIEKYRPERVYLFGSASAPDAPEVNDLDFLIIKKDVPERGIDRIYEVDSLVDRRVPVDMIVYKPDEILERLDMGDPFVKIMVNKGKLLYGPSESDKRVVE